MSKVLVIGGHTPTDEELRLRTKFDLPDDTFKVPEVAIVPEVKQSGDVAYLEKLRSALTPQQLAYYPAVRSGVLHAPADPLRLHEKTTSWVGRLKATDSDAYVWMRGGNSRGSGRTFLLAVVYIEKALTYPGQQVHLNDHHPHGDDILDSQVKDLVELDDDLHRRSVFGHRGILVIHAPDYVDSLIG